MCVHVINITNSKTAFLVFTRSNTHQKERKGNYDILYYTVSTKPTDRTHMMSQLYN